MMRLLFITVLALGLTAPTVGTLAHHGWSWTTGGNIDLTGIIKTVRLGNPHGILKIDVEGDEWTAEAVAVPPARTPLMMPVRSMLPPVVHDQP
ncbi:MAG: hypothetical protein OXC14_17780 [Rhodospirillaceae bacterium]|nr:hypothetical protein [Rhodospirillaceae bacterium]